MKSLLATLLILSVVALAAKWSAGTEGSRRPLWPHDLVLARPSVSLCDLEIWEEPSPGAESTGQPIASYSISIDGALRYVERVRREGAPEHVLRGRLLPVELTRLKQALQESRFDELPAELPSHGSDREGQMVVVVRCGNRAVQAWEPESRECPQLTKRFRSILDAIQDAAGPALKECPEPPLRL